MYNVVNCFRWLWNKHDEYDEPNEGQREAHVPYIPRQGLLRGGASLWYRNYTCQTR